MYFQVVSPLKRVAIFYDGSYFFRLSNFYKYYHPRHAFIDITGLQEYIRTRVAGLECNNNVALCQIIESHLFRGRFSFTTAKAANAIETDRLHDQLLMYAGVITHYYPMNEKVSPPEEKGIDVWLALEAYDLAVHKSFDVMVLFAGDQDYVPLIRKINGLGTRVLVIGVDLQYKDQNGYDRFQKTSPRLIDEASYAVMLTEEVDSTASRNDRVVDGIFQG